MIRPVRRRRPEPPRRLHLIRKHTILLAAAVLLAGAFFAGALDVFSSAGKSGEWQPQISPMGAIARGDEPRPDADAILRRYQAMAPGGPASTTTLQGNDIRVDSSPAPDFQSETTIAVAGNQVVAGYNDYRGFTNLGSQFPATSLSGVSYSADGGATWTDIGQLPLLTGTDLVYGDPDVKSWVDPGGDKHFYYSSLYVNTIGQSSLSVHESVDGGATWSTPREVTTATSPTDFPDKELMDVDKETGRIFISFTNFGASTRIRVTYSDDGGVTWPVLHDFGLGGQGSIPRAAGNSNNVYVTWRNGGNIVFSRSIDNGATWSAPVSIVTGLGTPMNPYGSDRIHGFPSMDVEDASGDIYIVYSARQIAPDFSDVYMIKSVNGGVSWSSPLLLNAAPGDDRAQFFPWVAADANTGNVSVVWYDQILGQGTSDLTDVFHTHTRDGGATWSCPTPLTDRSFHAEYGNATSQPNIGDYIQVVSENNRVFTAFGGTDNDPKYFTEAPHAYVDVHDLVDQDDAPIAFAGFNFVDTGCRSGNGYWEPCETVDLFTTVINYSVCAASITGLTGTLTTSHPGVTITNGTQSFGSLVGQNSTGANSDPFVVDLDPTLPCGEQIEFVIVFSSSSGPARVPFTVRLGHPVVTPLLTEAFDGETPPNLPAGWTTSQLVGTLNPWGTSTTFAQSGPNSVFCADIGSTSLNRLLSPTLGVPATTDLVLVSFDVTHDIEIDSERRAWDGALMRVVVFGSPFLAGSFASSFEPFYPWQMNRQNSAGQPLQDLACWSDNTTPNFNHVSMEFPSLANTQVNLAFDMGTDGSVGTPTGMFIDNIDVRAIEFMCDCTDPPAVTAIPDPLEFFGAPSSQTTCDTLYIVNTGATDLLISGVTGCTTPPWSLDTSMLNTTVAKGDTTKVVVCVTPTAADPDTCFVTISSNDPGGPTVVPVYLNTVTGIATTPSLALDPVAIVPNPFNPETVVRFTLGQQATVTVDVWSVAGARVRTLARERAYPAGPVSLRWDGRDERGQAVASGVYFVRVQTPQATRTARAVMLK